MRLGKYIAGLAGIVAATALSVTAAQAQSPEEFYKDKVVTLVVSAGPGSATDFFGREFAPYLSKHLPGNPDVVVENLPGASGMKAAIQLQTRDPKDGTSIALLQRNNFYLPLIDPTVQFDPRAVNWIGSLNKEYYTVIVWENVPAETDEDLFTTPLKLGATSFANENRTLAAMLNDHFGTQFEIVPGYESNQPLSLALERGEIQARMQTTNTLKAGIESQWYDEGKVRVLAQIGLEKAPGFEDVPNLYERATDPEVQSLARFMLAPLAAGRPFAVPGEVPEDRLQAIEDAFLAAAADPEFVKRMEELGSDLEPIDAAAMKKIIDDLYDTSPEVLEEVKKLLIPS